MAKRKKRRRPARRRARTGQRPRSVPQERRQDEDDYIAFPMALLFSAISGSHLAAAMLQKPLSTQTRQRLLDTLDQGIDDVVSIADRLVAVGEYFDGDVPAMHTRIFLENLDADQDPCLVELESDWVDTGMADDETVVLQALWVLSVLIVTERRNLEPEPFRLYEIPEPVQQEIEQLLTSEVVVGDMPPISCFPFLYHESDLPEEWRDFIDVLSERIAEEGKQFVVGENEGSILARAEAMSQFGRFFPLNSSLASEILDQYSVDIMNMSFYRYQDYLAIHGHRDDEEGRLIYSEYLGSRALSLAQLRAAARERERDIEFVDVTVTADELYAWLDREGLPNTPQNRALYVQQRPGADGPPTSRRTSKKRKRRKDKKRGTAGDLRMTVCAYGKDADTIDFVEAVIHTGKGEIVDSKVWEGEEDVDAVTDEIVAFAQERGISEIRQVSEVMSPETCDCCGERTHRIVTDEDAARGGVTGRLHWGS